MLPLPPNQLSRLPRRPRRRRKLSRLMPRLLPKLKTQLPPRKERLLPLLNKRKLKPSTSPQSLTHLLLQSLLSCKRDTQTTTTSLLTSTEEFSKPIWF